MIEDRILVVVGVATAISGVVARGGGRRRGGAAAGGRRRPRRGTRARRAWKSRSRARKPPPSWRSRDARAGAATKAFSWRQPMSDAELQCVVVEEPLELPAGAAGRSAKEGHRHRAPSPPPARRVALLRGFRAADRGRARAAAGAAAPADRHAGDRAPMPRCCSTCTRRASASCTCGSCGRPLAPAAGGGRLALDPRRPLRVGRRGRSSRRRRRRRRRTARLRPRAPPSTSARTRCTPSRASSTTTRTSSSTARKARRTRWRSSTRASRRRCSARSRRCARSTTAAPSCVPSPSSPPTTIGTTWRATARCGSSTRRLRSAAAPTTASAR